MHWRVHNPIPRSALGPVFLLSVLVLLMFWYRPTPRPVIAPPWAVPGWFPFEWNDATGEPRPTPAPISGPSQQRVELAITSAQGLYTLEEQGVLANDVEQALMYVSGRFQSGPDDNIQVEIGDNAGCSLHGVAYTDARRIQVFTCADLPRSRVVNILAHEFVHQLAHDRYGAPHLQADLILAEGLATWGAGHYWLGGEPDFRTFVRDHYLHAGALLPLATNYAGRPIADMNTLYYQWASFTKFLIEVYGRESFDALYVTGNDAPGSADYAGIYGKDLNQLEQEWLQWLEP